MTTNNYDIVIIGGGPSGSICAIFLKNINPCLRVCIIDKQSFPRNKPCGDGLSPGVVDILIKAGLDISFLEKHPIANFELSCGDSIEIKYDLRNLSEDNSYGFVYEREKFDEKLINYAVEVGVHVFQKHEIYEIKEIDQFSTQINCQYGNTNFGFVGRIIVGADGCYSKIRSYLKIPRNVDNHLGIGLRYYCTIKSSEKLSIRLDILKDLKYSYGWLFPISNYKANVGIGVDANIYKQNNINLNKEFDHYLAFLNKRIQVELIPGTRAGYPLPYGSQMPKLIHGNKVLIGDAASMINPLTGEGIYYGMYAGKDLAVSIANDFTSNNKLTDALSRFSDGFQRQFKNHYQLNLMIKKFVSSSYSDVYLNMIVKDKALLNKVMNIILGNSNNLNMGYLKFKVMIKLIKHIYEQLKNNISK